MNKMTLRQFKTRHERGDFASGDFKAMCEAGWFNWFCNDRALAGRLKKIGNILKTPCEIVAE